MDFQNGYCAVEQSAEFNSICFNCIDVRDFN